MCSHCTAAHSGMLISICSGGLITTAGRASALMHCFALVLTPDSCVVVWPQAPTALIKPTTPDPGRAATWTEMGHRRWLIPMDPEKSKGGSGGMGPKSSLRWDFALKQHELHASGSLSLRLLRFCVPPPHQPPSDIGFYMILFIGPQP